MRKCPFGCFREFVKMADMVNLLEYRGNICYAKFGQPMMVEKTGNRQEKIDLLEEIEKTKIRAQVGMTVT